MVESRIIPRCVLAASLALIAQATSAADVNRTWTQHLSGDVTRVIDASVLEVDGDRIRLWGLYAPGTTTRRGAEASVFVNQITLGKLISCEEKGRAQGVILAQCWLDGTDLTETIIAAGYGRECKRDSMGAYKDFEAPFVVLRMPLPPACDDT